MKTALSRPGSAIRLLSPMVVALTLLAVSANGQEREVRIYTLMSEGIEAYDAGDFETAIARYSEASTLDPNNTAILYERALAYLAVGDYDSCIRDAEHGLELGSANEAVLITSLGSCYSDRGDRDLAVRTFEGGIARFPDDIGLKFNIAVTLARSGESRRARSYLKTVLDTEPNLPSANMLLGQLYEADGYRIPAIFQYLRFLGTEPRSPRSGAAARALLDLIESGVQRPEDDGDLTVLVSTGNSGDDEGDFSALEIALAMVQAASPTAPGQDGSPAVAAVAAVAGAVDIARGVAGEALHDTWVWQHAVSFALDLQDTGYLEAMSYLAFSGLDGAREWIGENSGSVERFRVWREENALPRN